MQVTFYKKTHGGPAELVVPPSTLRLADAIASVRGARLLHRGQMTPKRRLALAAALRTQATFLRSLAVFLESGSGHAWRAS